MGQQPRAHIDQGRAALERAVADVRRLRAETEDKVTELEEALERLRRATDEVPSPGAPAGQEAPPALPTADQAPAEPRAEQQPGYNEAMLRAAQMAVAGDDRGRIEAALRERYGVSDPRPIVERILGPSVR